MKDAVQAPRIEPLTRHRHYALATFAAASRRSRGCVAPRHVRRRPAALRHAPRAPRPIRRADAVPDRRLQMSSAPGVGGEDGVRERLRRRAHAVVRSCRNDHRARRPPHRSTRAGTASGTCSSRRSASWWRDGRDPRSRAQLALPGAQSRDAEVLAGFRPQLIPFDFAHLPLVPQAMYWYRGRAFERDPTPDDNEPLSSAAN